MGLDIENEKSSKIQNLVLLDLETTGLIRPEITELAICSIPFNLISNLSAVERVGNKLVLCFMPTRPIDPYAQTITNLSEEKLHGFDSFGPSSLKLLDAYIESLAKPIICVAHNGFNFDFALLKKTTDSFDRDSIHSDETLFLHRDDVFLADSLQHFREQDLKRALGEHGENSFWRLSTKTNECWTNYQLREAIFKWPFCITL